MKDAKNEKKLLLVDGHGLAFRGFYALPEMNAPDGTPTNAVLGFINMLLKAVEEWRPEGIGLFFDPKGPTRRDEMFEAYKAGRRPTPDEFRVQMPYIFELSEALGFPIFIEEGVEADDLIASTALAAAAEGWETVILSADKDLLQLLRAGVTLARPTRGISEMRVYDEGSFASEYGFAPGAMADYLALVGDAADNISGVAGIGDKTARQLLAAYGSLDKIYASLDDLTKGQRAKLTEGRESAYRSLSLVLPQEVPAVDRAALHRAEIRYPQAVELCKKLGLKRLGERLGLDAPNIAQGAGVETRGGNRPFALSETALDELLREKTLVLADAPLTLMSPDGRWTNPGDAGLTRLFDWLSENRLILANYRKWCGEYPAFRELPENVLDVELAHYFFHPDAKTHALADVAGTGAATGEEGASRILRLWNELDAGELSGDMRRVMAEIDAPLTPALLRLQERGLAVDIPALRSLDDELNRRMREIEEEIYRTVGGVINLNSPKQVGALLFERLRLPVVKKTKTGYSTDVGVLEELSRLPEPLCEIPMKMLEYRECSKMSSGFVQPYIQHADDAPDRRIHSTFLHAVTGTGRLASRDPNAQNLPVFGEWAARFRRAIVPDGSSRVFVAADYSQIELRVLAHLSGEERLLEAFSKGRDIHLETASWVFGLQPQEIAPEQRRFAKTVNFGLLYGMGAHGLAQRMGIQRHQAAGLVDRYFSVLPKVKSYLEESAREAKARGYTRSVFGRVRPLSEVATVEGRGGNPIDRVAVNTPIQSTAADIAKIALIRFDGILREKHPEAFLVLQVHDSLICETPAELADEVEGLLVETMEGVGAIDVPLRAEPKRGNSLADI